MSVAPLSTTAGPRRALAVTAIGLLLVAVTLFLFWPLGVALGVALGVLVVLGVARQQERADRAVSVEDLSALAPALAPMAPARPVAMPPVAVQPMEVREAAPVAVPAPAAPATAEQGVRADLVRLEADLGDDYPDFARAARLVVSTQYASAARLQRDLQLPYSRARRLLADLETERFVGPATGTLPRQVLLPKERLPEIEQLFAGV